MEVRWKEGVGSGVCWAQELQQRRAGAGPHPPARRLAKGATAVPYRHTARPRPAIPPARPPSSRRATVLRQAHGRRHCIFSSASCACAAARGAQHSRRVLTEAGSSVSRVQALGPWYGSSDAAVARQRLRSTGEGGGGRPTVRFWVGGEEGTRSLRRPTRRRTVLPAQRAQQRPGGPQRQVRCAAWSGGGRGRQQRRSGLIFAMSHEEASTKKPPLTLPLRLARCCLRPALCLLRLRRLCARCELRGGWGGVPRGRA